MDVDGKIIKNLTPKITWFGSSVSNFFVLRATATFQLTFFLSEQFIDRYAFGPFPFRSVPLSFEI